VKKVRFVFKSRSALMPLIVTVVLIYGMYSFWSDFNYFFKSSTPIDLGAALKTNKELLAKVEAGDYARIKGIRSIKGGKITKGFLGEKYMTYFFMGSPDFIVVEKMHEEKEKNAGAKRVTVNGRIYPLKHSPEMMKLRDFFEKNFLVEMNRDGFLIYAGEEPGKDYYSVSFFILLFIFLVLNTLLTIRSFKRGESVDDDFE